MTNIQKPDPQKLARELLIKEGIENAPVPVEKLAKALGAQIRFSPLDDELSGMIFIKDGIPIIGVNSLHHPNRQRFTIAHEIGHLVMHKDHLSNEVHVDKQFRVLMRDGDASNGTNLIEIEANRFAAELLMPEFLLAKLITSNTFDIDDEAPLDSLAKKFRVSKQTLEFRMRTPT